MNAPPAEPAGRIDGSISAVPKPAYIHLSGSYADEHIGVHDAIATLGLVEVTIGQAVRLHLHTPGQAREFIRAFALALEMLEPAPRDLRIVNPTTHALEQLPPIPFMVVPDTAQPEDLPFADYDEPADLS